MFFIKVENLRRCMKKILLMGSLLTLSLFAKEEVVTPKIEMNFSLNDDAKILVDCSYKKVKKLGFIGGAFASKFYSDDENINNLKSIVCKDTFPEQREISLKDLYNAAKTVVKDTDYDTSLFTDVNQNSFNNEIYYLISFRKSRFMAPNYNVETPFLVASFENSKLIVKQKYNLPGTYEDLIKEQNYLIKSYNYDYKNKKVTSFEIDKPLDFDTPITFTDTYDIDAATECINGKVWIKKYGNTAGEHCKWIEIEKVSNNPFESLNVQVTGVSGKGNFIELFFNYQNMRCNIKMDFLDNKYSANEFFCVESDGVEYYSEFPSLINTKHTYTLVNKKDKQPISKIFPIEKSMLDIIKSSN